MWIIIVIAAVIGLVILFAVMKTAGMIPPKIHQTRYAYALSLANQSERRGTDHRSHHQVTGMKRSVIAVALILTGCSNKGDPAICTVITDPVESESSEQFLKDEMSPSWNKAKADACVHRQAYRLSQSSDPAATIAKAAVEICGGEIATSAILNANEEVHNRIIAMNQRDRRADAIAHAYEAFALSKVVEGRAGKCKA